VRVRSTRGVGEPLGARHGDMLGASAKETLWAPAKGRVGRERAGGLSLSDAGDAAALRRPLINKLTNPCYRVLCPGHGASAAQSAFVMNSGPLPGSDDAEAQRRR
jgi:hypothetical protein